tara:strand:+ start:515 stop:715 length:201 start_codon:yes stop_codon:yes gene_type:complete
MFIVIASRSLPYHYNREIGENESFLPFFTVFNNQVYDKPGNSIPALLGYFGRFIFRQNREANAAIS